MIRQILTIAATPLLIPVMMVAESLGPQLSAPQLGYVYDASAQSIRLISGVPGAATLDGSVSVGATFTKAWVHSPSQRAVGIAKDGVLTLANWSGEAPVADALDSGLAVPVMAGFSRSGGYVAISDGSAAEIWSSSNASLIASYSPQDGITAIAVNDRGDAAVATGSGQIMVYSGDAGVVAATSVGQSTNQQQARPQNSRRSSGAVAASSGGTWGALAFLPNGNDLVGADGSQLVRIDDAATSPGRSVMADLGGTARAIAVSLDGVRIAAAVGQGVAVVSGGGSVQSLDCGCEADGLEPLTGNLVVYLTPSAEGLVQVLDADGAAARLINIPHQSSSIENNGGIAQ